LIVPEATVPGATAAGAESCASARIAAASNIKTRIVGAALNSKIMKADLLSL
jgi:hypothetical protein